MTRNLEKVVHVEKSTADRTKRIVNTGLNKIASLMIKVII